MEKNKLNEKDLKLVTGGIEHKNKNAINKFSLYNTVNFLYEGVLLTGSIENIYVGEVNGCDLYGPKADVFYDIWCFEKKMMFQNISEDNVFHEQIPKVEG